MSNIYQYAVTTIQGEEQTLAPYEGNVLLVVNTASKCGFTPQFKGLQELYEAYQSQGFTVLGFPCNQFLSQDPGSNEEIAEFCSLNYQVTFPMFAKVDVNGEHTHPLFAHLKKESSGLLGSDIKWNFTKFLVDQKGNVVKRYAPMTKPEDIKVDIEKLLAK